jgi:hypothetical protein
MVLFRSEFFFSDNTRVRIFIFFCRAKCEFFFQNSTLGYMTKTLNQIIFFSSTKIRIFKPTFSLLQGKHLPFSHSPLRLNIFRLFVILSLTQLYRYTPEIFLFSTATFKYTYRAPSDKLDKNSRRTWLKLI